jgi:uncharacterized protein YjiS (DUF1127 family)
MPALPTHFAKGHAANPAYALTFAPRPSGGRSLGARIAALIRRHVDEYRARRAVTRLEVMTMSDRELRDIGLRRADVEPGWESFSAYAFTEAARFDRF